VLLKISLIFSIVGISVLFFISKNISVEEKKINQLKEDEMVLIRGNVSAIYEGGNVTKVELTQNNKIDLVFFKPGYLNINVGDEIEAIGKTKENGGRIELIAEEVRKI